MRARSSLIAVIVCIGGIACGTPAHQEPPASDAMGRRVSELADRYVRAFLEAYPHYAPVVGAPEVHPDRLGDHSLAGLQRWQEEEDRLLAELKAIDPDSVQGAQARVTYRILQHQLEASRDLRVCRDELWNVSPTFSGWQGQMPLIAGMQAVGTPQEQEYAVARWSGLPKYLDDEIANLGEGLRLGYSAPKGNVVSVIGQMDAMLATPIAESPFVQMGRDVPALRARLEELERTAIRPAIARYRDFLRETYLPAAREAIGVDANPRGDECYRAAVKYHASVEMTPQRIHDLGLAQMEKIRSEMAAIGRRTFGTDDPAEVLKRVTTDPQYRFRSREELIATAEAAIERARAALPKWFGRIPKAPVIVEPYPAFLEKTAPGGQAVAPSADRKPGKYLINAYQATEQSRAGLESTAFHEAYPGHHLQAALVLERDGLHPISRHFHVAGFGEGWGLYAERLADEMGLFSSDVDRLGMLSNEALRAARLVVDSGMHALGWSRQQAIDYIRTHTTETEARATAEVDRYIAVPAQATAYMIGALEIRRLRTEAEQALGDAFDIRAFHDMVLEDGPMPLWALEEKVKGWIASR
ncbi:MAG TPA: DUF885 domain-containing protein [Vicinamibacterales bacterium]